MRDFSVHPQRADAAGLTASNLRLMRGGQRVLDIPDLTLAGAGPTVILGPNGAGKSLLLRCLHGLERPDSGTVHVDGAPLDRTARLQQAMVFQHPVLLRRSVAGNLDYVLRHRRVPRQARKTQIAALLSEGGLEARARQPARSLSGGEAQRLAILRALACAPRQLFLDEPTSALDPAATQAIEAMVLRASARGIRVVMVTHDIGQARRLGRDIVLMRAGRVVEHSAAHRFFAAPESAAARQYLAGALLL